MKETCSIYITFEKKYLSCQVNNLNQEVSNLAKRLHDIIHFLPSPVAMLHCAPAVTSYSYSSPVAPSPTVSVAAHWQPHSPLNIPSGLHLHHQAISHPPRNVWGCSRMPSQVLSPSLLRSSSSTGSCLHLCCSDRDAATGHRFQGPCGIFQTSRTTPNSPYMSHQQHLQRAPSLAALSSVFGSIPVIGQSPPMAYNPSLPTMNIPHSTCPPGNPTYSHPSISVQIDSSPSRGRPAGQPPIHSSVTPVGQSQYQTTFSSVVPSGVNASVCSGHLQSQQQSPASRFRQSSPLGSSPVHRMQDFAYSLLGDAASRDCSSMLGQERTD